MCVVVEKKRERVLGHVGSEAVKAPDPWLCLPQAVAMRHMW